MLMHIVNFGIWCFIFLVGAQFILRKTYVKNYIYIMEPNKETEILLRNTLPPFDGILPTLITCMIPVLNIIMIAYYLVLGLTTDEEKLYELRQSMRELKNER